MLCPLAPPCPLPLPGSLQLARPSDEAQVDLITCHLFTKHRSVKGQLRAGPEGCGSDNTESKPPQEPTS